MISLEKLKNKFNDTSKIIGREKYFNSAVLVCLCEIDGSLNFLFQKRAKDIRQGGEICFPGGGFDKDLDNNLLETAIRETIEEIGISRDNIEVLGEVGTLIIPTGVIVNSYLAYIKFDDLSEFNINADEVDRLLFVPIDFFLENKPQIEKIGLTSTLEYIEDGVLKTFPAKELNLPEMYQKPWSGRPRKVYFYFYEDEVIWGITADIIKEVILNIKNIIN